MITDPLLIIEGFQEGVNPTDPGSDPWQIVHAPLDAGAHDIKVCECVQNDDAYAVTFADLAGRKWVFVYSWGGETLRKITADFTTLAADFLVMVLPVSDPTGITRSAWDLSAFKGRAWCFNLGPDLSFPVSIPIANAPWQDFASFIVAPLRAAPLVNINIASLAKPVPWYLAWFLGGRKIDNHTHVMNDPALLSAIVKLVQEAQALSPASPPQQSMFNGSARLRSIQET